MFNRITTEQASHAIGYTKGVWALFRITAWSLTIYLWGWHHGDKIAFLSGQPELISEAEQYTIMSAREESEKSKAMNELQDFERN